MASSHLLSCRLIVVAQKGFPKVDLSLRLEGEAFLLEQDASFPIKNNKISLYVSTLPSLKVPPIFL